MNHFPILGGPKPDGDDASSTGTLFGPNMVFKNDAPNPIAAHGDFESARLQAGPQVSGDVGHPDVSDSVSLPLSSLGNHESSTENLEGSRASNRLQRSIVYRALDILKRSIGCMRDVAKKIREVLGPQLNEEIESSLRSIFPERNNIEIGAYVDAVVRATGGYNPEEFTMNRITGRKGEDAVAIIFQKKDDLCQTTGLRSTLLTLSGPRAHASISESEVDYDLDSEKLSPDGTSDTEESQPRVQCIPIDESLSKFVKKRYDDFGKEPKSLRGTKRQRAQKK